MIVSCAVMVLNMFAKILTSGWTGGDVKNATAYQKKIVQKNNGGLKLIMYNKDNND
jgi:hypothetical protein